MDYFEQLPNGQVLMVEQIGENIVESHYDMVLHVELTPDKAQIAANDADTATITAKVFDFQGGPFEYAGDITFNVEGEVFTVHAVNGAAAAQVTSNLPTEIKVSASVPNGRAGEVVIHAI